MSVERSDVLEQAFTEIGMAGEVSLGEKLLVRDAVDSLFARRNLETADMLVVLASLLTSLTNYGFEMPRVEGLVREDAEYCMYLRRMDKRARLKGMRVVAGTVLSKEEYLVWKASRDAIDDNELT